MKTASYRIKTVLGWVVTVAAGLCWFVNNPVFGQQSKPTASGYCCIAGRLSVSSARKCHSDQGTFFATRSEAEENCRTSRKTAPSSRKSARSQKGYCCIKGDVRFITEQACIKEEGRFSIKRGKAERICGAIMGYCCEQGIVLNVTKAQCDNKAGTFAVSQAQAERICNALKGFCCKKGKVAALTKGRCDHEKGSFFMAKPEAEQACKTAVKIQPKPRPASRSTSSIIPPKKPQGQLVPMKIEIKEPPQPPPPPPDGGENSSDEDTTTILYNCDMAITDINVLVDGLPDNSDPRINETFTIEVVLKTNSTIGYIGSLCRGHLSLAVNDDPYRLYDQWVINPYTRKIEGPATVQEAIKIRSKLNGNTINGGAFKITAALDTADYSQAGYPNYDLNLSNNTLIKKINVRKPELSDLAIDEMVVNDLCHVKFTLINHKGHIDEEEFNRAKVSLQKDNGEVFFKDLSMIDPNGRTRHPGKRVTYLWVPDGPSELNPQTGLHMGPAMVATFKLIADPFKVITHHSFANNKRQLDVYCEGGSSMPQH